MPDTTADPSVRFTDRDVRLIIASLPGQINVRRREMLPKLLREWAARDLREHLSREATERIAQRLECVEAIAQHYADAAKLLDSLDERGLDLLTFTMAKSPAAVAPDRKRFVEASGVIQQEPERLQRIAVAAREASKIWRRGRGRPRNLVGYLILLDVAALYEWLTGRAASRTIDRVDGVDAGPFWDFASAVWPLIFGSDYGLSHGLKSWASARNKYGESSPLIANMALRYPEWRLFGD
jgi:hypothetical protein